MTAAAASGVVEVRLLDEADDCRTVADFLAALPAVEVIHRSGVRPNRVRARLAGLPRGVPAGEAATVSDKKAAASLRRSSDLENILNTGNRVLAARFVTVIVAGMVTAVSAASAVGFWLSYGALHDFAWRTGLCGAYSWAWPASVDLFVLAGEAGVTLAALRKRHDPMAWAYLVLGFGASVTGNLLHVAPGALPWWARYAVAAVPPMAAMLALAALLRQVYRLVAEPAGTVPGTPYPAWTPPVADPMAVKFLAPVPPAELGAAEPHPLAAEVFADELAAGVVPGVRRIRKRLQVGGERATRVREHLRAMVARDGAADA